MTEQQNAVNAMIERIERHQAALKLNDSRFVARYQRFLGSTKTWRDRLCERAWGEFGDSLTKWEQKLRAFIAEIDGTSDISDFMEALPIARYGQQLYDALQGQRSDRRVAWLIGPTGVGKSWTMLKLAKDNPTQAVYLHINRGAKDSMMSIASMMARAVAATLATSGSGTFANVVEALKANPLTLIIDDVHEGGVLMLKLVKHLVDDTRAKLILGTYPTAWNALVNGSTDAHSEAQQLLGRSLKPVEKRWMKGAQPADVAAYLKLALGGNGECKVLADKIAPILQRNGNFRALADAVELARINSDDNGEELTPEFVEAAVHQICPAERT
jgi:hypothetical protein